MEHKMFITIVTTAHYLTVS